MLCMALFGRRRPTSLCFLAELSPRELVEPLDEELPVVEQLLDM